jgi:TolB-like protein
VNARRSFLAELNRRNVPRAGALYAAGTWALAQGIAQLGPAFGAPDWVTRWFVIACVIGFPLWLAFAWFYEFTPQGLRRESEIAPADPIAHSTARKLDFWIIGILGVAVVLLLTNQLVGRKDVNPGATAARVDASSTASIPEKSIAVLPLVNDSGDKDQQYFSDGLSEDFINALSQFEGLKVIGRNSAFQFRNSTDDAKAIGAKLGVTHLLEGSVRREGDEVRISAELINTRDGSTLWSQHYDRPYKNLFALQDEITHAIASALQAKLLESSGAVAQSDRPPSGNLAAYSAFLQAKSGEGGTQAAIADLQRAIRLDPGYAAAYAFQSKLWTALYNSGLNGADATQAIANARAAADSALALDPDLADAHLAHASLLVSADFNWAGAEAEARRAVQLAPADSGAVNSLARMLAAQGHPHEAIGLLRRSLSLDPRNTGAWRLLRWQLLILGRLDEAEQATRVANSLLPPGAKDTYVQLASIAVLRGNFQAALNFALRERGPSWRRLGLALARQIGPDHAAADSALQTLIAHDAGTAAFQIAEVYALRKDPDNVFKWLDRAWDTRDSGITTLLYDPFIQRYKSDPRFAVFCRKVGLPVPVPGRGG